MPHSPAVGVMEHHNMSTSTPDSSTSNVTSAHTDHTEPHHGSSEVGTIVAIVLTVVIVASLLGLIYYLLKKRGKLRHLPGFKPIRSRRSSTSDSTRVLPHETDLPELPPDIITSPHDRPHDDDAFAIEDHEDDNTDQQERDEYFYDEVFGQSHFEDERTNAAVRDLYSTTEEDGAEDEMLDFDFETLGIKIEDYKFDPGRKAMF